MTEEEKEILEQQKADEEETWDRISGDGYGSD